MNEPLTDLKLSALESTPDAEATLARWVQAPRPPGARRLDLDERNVRNGLGQLVLTLVKLVHELLERQAIRRMDAGTLSDEQLERLGETLMKQAEEIGRLCREMGVDERDLNLDLGPLGRLL